MVHFIELFSSISPLRTSWGKGRIIDSIYMEPRRQRTQVEVYTSPKDECECKWYPFTHLTGWELDRKWVDLPDTHSPLPPRTDHGSISFEHSGDKRGVSAKTLGEVNAISTALKWALTDLSNVNRGRTLRLVLWTGDTRYHHLYPQVKIERIKRRGRKGYLDRKSVV